MNCNLGYQIYLWPLKKAVFDVIIFVYQILFVMVSPSQPIAASLLVLYNHGKDTYNFERTALDKAFGCRVLDAAHPDFSVMELRSASQYSLDSDENQLMLGDFKSQVKTALSLRELDNPACRLLA